MEKVWVVRVRDWSEETHMVVFSINRTEAGATASAELAKREYHTDHVSVDEEEVGE